MPSNAFPQSKHSTHMSTTTATFQSRQTKTMASPSKPQPSARLNSCDLLISVLECYMMERIRQNERNDRAEKAARSHHSRTSAEPSVFHALQAPSITPVEYLRRLSRYSFCSRSVFVAAFFYLERVAAIPHVHLALNTLCVHRLVLTAVLLATKVVDDVLYDNAHFAKVGGLEVKELNMLELDMLKVLNFKLYISAEEFEAFEKRLLEAALATSDPDFTMLPSRLRSLGYSYAPRSKVAPSSPTSSMEVSFVAP